MRVDLRGLQVRVPQHLLDKADVRAVVQHQRRHRVTEQVTRSGFAHIGLLDVFGYQAAQPIRRQRQTIWLDKDLLVVRLGECSKGMSATTCLYCGLISCAVRNNVERCPEPRLFVAEAERTVCTFRWHGLVIRLSSWSD